MLRLLFVLVALALLPTSSFGQSKPSAITWEWFNAAETYKHLAKKTPSAAAIAAKYYRMAALGGNTAAAYKLGEMYENGLGIAKDFQQALRWYRNAADGGDKYGQFRVGYFYQKGVGVAIDLPEAAKWYKRSADEDNAWAYDMLAFMLADGQGLARNDALAIRYFEISLPHTNDNWARWKLGLLLAFKDPKQSMALLGQSAASGNPEAIKALGLSANPNTAATTAPEEPPYQSGKLDLGTGLHLGGWQQQFGSMTGSLPSRQN